MNNNHHTFREAIRAADMEPPKNIIPGELHRMPGKDKYHTNRAGWCILFYDGLGGCYGDWSRDMSETWRATKTYSYTKAEQKEFSTYVKIAAMMANIELEERQNDAAKRAKAIWDEAEPVPVHHPYLARKGIHSNIAKFDKGALVLPIYDFSNILTSLQFIYPNGRKYFLAGGRKKGCYIPVSCTSRNPSRLIVCEGWATGCTLSEDESDAMVLAALDAGNLKAVAIAASHHMPSADLVIAGDDDRLTPGNPGATKARTAAIASGAKLALPRWPKDAPEHLTDFNDLAIWLAGGAT